MNDRILTWWLGMQEDVQVWGEGAKMLDIHMMEVFDDYQPSVRSLRAKWGCGQTSVEEAFYRYENSAKMKVSDHNESNSFCTSGAGGADLSEISDQIESAFSSLVRARSLLGKNTTNVVTKSPGFAPPENALPSWWVDLMISHRKAGGSGNLSYKSWRPTIVKSCNKTGVGFAQVAQAYDWLCFSGQGLAGWMDNHDRFKNPTERLKVMLRIEKLPDVVADSSDWGSTVEKMERFTGPEDPALRDWVSTSATQTWKGMRLDDAEDWARSEGVTGELFKTAWKMHMDELRLAAKRGSGYNV